MRISILMPCLDDAETAIDLLQETTTYLLKAGHEVSFLIVDDGSQEPLAARLQCVGAAHSVEVMELKRNLGHQRAIACGLCLLSEQSPPPEVVVVMDSDGEDRPEDIPTMVESLISAGGGHLIAFAERIRRTEGPVFWLGYVSYLTLHRALVGHAPRVGNFSAFTGSLLGGIVTDPDLWSHYAASLWKSRVRKVLVPLPRGNRRRGVSRLGLGGLILHGLAAIACYREILALRLLVGCCLLLCGSLCALLLALFAPTWEKAVAAASIAVGSMMFLLLLAFGQCLLVMQGRNQSTVVPVNDYRSYVRAVHKCK
jgi:glycosyltransferase involved in cell wall biosynthesis